ncbi:MAG: hypothetical protein BWZ02_02205 [Lentisphaerae bacterium ADurb.BinA184]|nr:MAG: hypothetical protein BWZ02_02205 [Lentisphaerae bacterium ADurb.BinA184]
MLGPGFGGMAGAGPAVGRADSVPDPQVGLSLRTVEDVTAFTDDLSQVNTPRPTVTHVNAGETFRAEVRVQDLRDDDDGNPGNGVGDQFGVFAAYVDLWFDPASFSVPPGVSESPPDKPLLQRPWPVSYKNGDYGVAGDTVTYGYPYGPQGTPHNDLGVINDAGGFWSNYWPGRQPRFLLDVRLVAGTLIAGDDVADVNAGRQADLDVLANDRLIQGPHSLHVGSRASQLAPAPASTEMIVYAGMGSVVPDERVAGAEAVINVVNPGVLQIAEWTQGARGTVRRTTLQGGQGLAYTPHAGARGTETDSFTYVLADGLGHARTATVSITIHTEPASDETLTLRLEPGWNQLCLPFVPSATRGLADLLVDDAGSPLSAGPLFGWAPRGGYAVIGEPPEAGAGFWAYSPQGGIVRTLRGPAGPGVTALEPGWNLAGVTEGTPVAEFLAAHTDIASVWRWDSRLRHYGRAGADEDLARGQGYWFLLTGAIRTERPPLP